MKKKKNFRCPRLFCVSQAIWFLPDVPCSSSCMPFKDTRRRRGVRFLRDDEIVLRSNRRQVKLVAVRY